MKSGYATVESVMSPRAASWLRRLTNAAQEAREPVTVALEMEGVAKKPACVPQVNIHVP
jgi:hypothetical protein